MPKAKKRVTKKAYKAKRGRRYQSHTQTEGSSFIGAGRATVKNYEGPMVPFRNTGLITPPPLMQLPTNWQRMSQMGIQPAQFPNDAMPLVKVEPKPIAQQQSEQVQQVGQAMRQASMVHQAGQDIQQREAYEAAKKKAKELNEAAERAGVQLNISSDIRELFAQGVSNQDPAIVPDLIPILQQSSESPPPPYEDPEVIKLTKLLQTGLGLASPVRPPPPFEEDEKYAESPAPTTLVAATPVVSATPTSNVGRIVESTLKDTPIQLFDPDEKDLDAGDLPFLFQSPVYSSSSSSSAATSKETPQIPFGSPASPLTPVPATQLVSPPSKQLLLSPEVNQLRQNYLDSLKLKKQAVEDFKQKKITREELNAATKASNDALKKLTQGNEMRETPARVALPNTPAASVPVTPAASVSFKTPALQRQMEILMQRYSPQNPRVQLSKYMSPSTMISEFKQVNQRTQQQLARSNQSSAVSQALLAGARASQPSASNLPLTPADKAAMRIFIRPLTPIQQEIANALETKASETKMKRGLVPIQEGRPGLRQNRKRRILFTPS